MEYRSSTPEFDRTIEGFNTGEHLVNARRQADARKLDDVLIVDVDCHHYETDNFAEILEYIEDPVIKQGAINTFAYKGSAAVLMDQPGYQDIGGRVSRYLERKHEVIPKGAHPREVEQTLRWMNALSVDYACLFPTLLLGIGLHPSVEMEIELCFSYNRWLTEHVLPEGGGRLYSMLSLPISEPDEALRQVETFGDCKHIAGFMVTSARTLPIHHNSNMKVFRAIEERGLALAFHSAINIGEPVFKGLNRFAAVHALGFPFFNILHVTNWVTNGLGERFPKLPVIWIEGGLAWVPFLMQRLDHEFLLRASEFPLLKKKPSDYMRDMYYASQPMERVDMLALECTFRMINAESQLMYASDYPHWDFDLPSTVWDLPFVSEKAKHNILGGTAARLFKLPPRNDKQKQNLARFGNLAA